MAYSNEQAPVDCYEMAFQLLVTAGASLFEAWDYSPRIAGNGWRYMLRYTAKDARLDLDMFRRTA